MSYTFKKVVVLCINMGGEPDIHTCTPEVTKEQIDKGEHYELAKANAFANGYSAPMIAFDAGDAAAHRLEEVAKWLNGPVI